MLNELCLSSLGREFVENLKFETNFNKIEIKLGEVAEFLQILKFEHPFPAQNYFNLIPELARIRLPGTFIRQEKLFDLKSSLITLDDVLNYINNLGTNKYPLIKRLSEGVVFERKILREIDRIVDERGNIKDNASELLGEIRKKQIKLSGEIDKAVRSVLVQARKSGWLNPNDEVTVRNGRLVIPVPASHKRRIRGFIHDESATGQTVFIEPAEALEANNEILELQNAEKREIVRILTVFTEMIRDRADDLIENYSFLGLIDFIRAKAALAIKINAIKPIFIDSSIIQWKEAVHPLLLLVHQKQKKHVEPLEIALDDENRILVI
ncbi:MAG: endonuclease MutS2, partial [Candidatus Moranbacteria bacterium]|nr:endonuclease MutS2 [Candidatus Moranbacteria bacterium]